MPFSDDAIARIHRLTQGAPSRRRARMALLADLLDRPDEAISAQQMAERARAVGDEGPAALGDLKRAGVIRWTQSERAFHITAAHRPSLTLLLLAVRPEADSAGQIMRQSRLVGVDPDTDNRAIVGLIDLVADFCGQLEGAARAPVDEQVDLAGRIEEHIRLAEEALALVRAHSGPDTTQVVALTRRLAAASSQILARLAGHGRDHLPRRGRSAPARRREALGALSVDDLASACRAGRAPRTLSVPAPEALAAAWARVVNAERGVTRPGADDPVIEDAPQVLPDQTARLWQRACSGETISLEGLVGDSDGWADAIRRHSALLRLHARTPQGLRVDGQLLGDVHPEVSLVSRATLDVTTKTKEIAA